MIECEEKQECFFERIYSRRSVYDFIALFGLGFLLFGASGELWIRFGNHIYIGSLSAPVLEELGKILIAIGFYPFLRKHLSREKAIISSLILSGIFFGIFEFVGVYQKYPDKDIAEYLCILAFKLVAHPAFTLLFGAVYLYMMKYRALLIRKSDGLFQRNRVILLGYFLAILGHSISNGMGEGRPDVDGFELWEIFRWLLVLFIVIIEYVWIMMLCQSASYPRPG